MTRDKIEQFLQVAFAIAAALGGAFAFAKWLQSRKASQGAKSAANQLSNLDQQAENVDAAAVQSAQLDDLISEYTGSGSGAGEAQTTASLTTGQDEQNATNSVVGTAAAGAANVL